jgi:hypothetical protein
VGYGMSYMYRKQGRISKHVRPISGLQWQWQWQWHIQVREKHHIDNG